MLNLFRDFRMSTLKLARHGPHASSVFQQWQIEALWRFQIPEDIREKYGYPEITEADKRKILGLNSAKLYGIRAIEDPEKRTRLYPPVPKDYESRMSDKLKTLLEFPGYAADNLSKFKDTYASIGTEPSHKRYGWIRRQP